MCWQLEEGGDAGAEGIGGGREVEASGRVLTVLGGVGVAWARALPAASASSCCCLVFPLGLCVLLLGALTLGFRE